ncbi:MAG: Calx-beta domain-containing protein, partial [Pyrinomonadaceae bacterium]
MQLESEGIVQYQSDNGYTWAGKIKGDDNFSGDVVLTVLNNSMSGLIYTPSAVYEIIPQADSRNVLVEVDQSRFLEERYIVPENIEGELNSKTKKIRPLDSPQADSGSLIDVLILYTPATRVALGGADQVFVTAQQAVAITNTAYQNSQVINRLRLAGASEVSYTETPSCETDLNWVTANANVAQLRNQYAADFVSLLARTSDCGGMGWLMQYDRVNTGFAPYAFSVVGFDYAVGNLTLAHELGHNMGLNHNREDSDPRYPPARPYAYGHYVNGIFRTVMSYGSRCPNGCTRIPNFSNPNVSIVRNNITYPTGIANDQDNARTLNETSYIVANFRDSGGRTCTYSISPTDTNVSAANGNGSFSVTTQAGCWWKATSDQSWLTVTNDLGDYYTGKIGMVGSGPVNYSFDSNLTTSGRTGTITAAGQTFTLTQAAKGISINDVTIAEPVTGTATATFTVSLSPASSQTITVNVTTANGTAAAPADYTANPTTTLTFAPGEISKQVQVTINSDNVMEVLENFFVNLSSATNATIADNQGIGTIRQQLNNSGKIAFTSVRDGNEEIYAMNADGSEQTRLTNNAAADGSPAFSPDGSKIAFASDRDGNAEIYVMNADGSGQTRLTNNAAGDVYPAFSPDGSKIAFSSSRDGNFEIYVMNADGSGQTRLTNNAQTDYDPAFSPDGSKIAFTSARDGNDEIYVMNADGSGQTRLTNNAQTDYQPAFSPDGSKIAFASARDGGNAEIYVMNADGSGQTRLTNNA